MRDNLKNMLTNIIGILNSKWGILDKPRRELKRDITIYTVLVISTIIIVVGCICFVLYGG